MKLPRPLQIFGVVLCLAATTLLIGCKPESTAARLKSPSLDCAITPSGSTNNGVCAGKPVSVTLSSSETIPLAVRNLRLAHDNNTLIRVAKTDDKLGLFAIDLTGNTIHQIGSAPFDEGISGLSVSGNRVVWGTVRKIHIYDFKTKEESQVETTATYPAPTISGKVAIWDGLFAYDLEKHIPLTITSTTGATRYPRISGDWIVSFDALYDGPEWGHGAKLYAHNLKTNEEFLIGEMAMGYGWQGFYAIDTPWVAWLSKPNLETNINDQSKLHLFNLETRTDRIVTPTAVITKTRSFPLNLQLDGNVVLYHLGRDLYGYDIARDVSFPIANPSSAGGDPIISNDRIVWETPTDKAYVLTIEQVIRGAVPPGGTAQSPIATPSGAVGASTSPLATPTQVR